MKRMAKIIAVLLTLLILAPSALALSTVQYVGGAEKFIFKPGTEESPTDLFAKFKDVIPGDSLTETIEVRNDLKSDTNIRLYLKSLGPQEDTDEFLSQLHMTVNRRGMAKIFNTTLDRTGQLSDWRYVGTIKPGNRMLIDLTLEVPIEMGNEFQEKMGYVDWVFRIEEIDADDTEDWENVPETGDKNDLIFYGGLILLSVIALIFLIFGKKKKKEEE